MNLETEVAATSAIDAVVSGSLGWCVIHGDNADVLPLIPDKGVAHVITDPPYEAEAHTLGRRQKAHDPKGSRDAAGWTHKIVSAPLPFPAITASERDCISVEIARLSSRWVVLFCQTEATHKWSEALQAGGDVTKRIGVWVKPDGQPQFSGDRPGCGFESIIFAHSKGRSKWNGGGRVAVFTHNKQESGDSRFGVEHPTRKPIALMLELVELFTDPGDIVLDPFCGSGTTGVACIRLGRRFIGIEKDAKYAAVAQERLAAEAQGLNLRDARAGQLPMFGGGK